MGKRSGNGQGVLPFPISGKRKDVGFPTVAKNHLRISNTIAGYWLYNESHISKTLIMGPSLRNRQKMLLEKFNPHFQNK
jgi:hypothetical protein